jgi:hypothetical protein
LISARASGLIQAYRRARKKPGRRFICVKRRPDVVCLISALEREV